jgi:hypothetical protein
MPMNETEDFSIVLNYFTAQLEKQYHFFLTTYFSELDFLVLESVEQNNLNLLEETEIFLKNKYDYRFNFLEKIILYANYYDDDL